MFPEAVPLGVQSLLAILLSITVCSTVTAQLANTSTTATVPDSLLRTVTVTQISSTTMTIYWDWAVSSTDIKNVTIVVEAFSDSSWILQQTLPSTLKYYTANNLQPDQRYQICILAVRNSGVTNKCTSQKTLAGDAKAAQSTTMQCETSTPLIAVCVALGVIVVILIGIIVFLLLQRKQHHKEQTTPPTKATQGHHAPWNAHEDSAQQDNVQVNVISSGRIGKTAKADSYKMSKDKDRRKPSKSSEHAYVNEPKQNHPHHNYINEPTRNSQTSLGSTLPLPDYPDYHNMGGKTNQAFQYNNPWEDPHSKPQSKA